MILIGRNLSPFVRRTATLMNLAGASYDSNPLAAATDADELAKFNPLRRVPALVLDNQDVIIDSHAIIDYILDTYDSEHVLCPATGEARRHLLYLSAVATGVMEKGVAAAYERNQRPPEFVYEPYRAKLLNQVYDGLAELERHAEGMTWLFGENPTLADVNAVVAYDFIKLISAETVEQAAPVHLAALSERANQHSDFANTRWVSSCTMPSAWIVWGMSLYGYLSCLLETLSPRRVIYWQKPRTSCWAVVLPISTRGTRLPPWLPPARWLNCQTGATYLAWVYPTPV
jgi:glutathione S-transferase